MAEPALDDPSWVMLCRGADLIEGGEAVSFEVLHIGQRARAFAIRYRGRVHAYLNRCTHVAMEMDWQPNRFFDDSGLWLLCATHGAVYAPDTGQCRGGPCRGGLVVLEVTEVDGWIRWRAQYPFAPVSF